MDRENISVEELYRIAIATIAEVKAQDVFRVKDLFRNIDWKHIPLKRRMRPGELVFEYSESELGKTTIKKISGKDGKTAKNQQKYIKI